MEKKTIRSKSKILSFLPKTSTVSFGSHPFSPRKDKRSESGGTAGAKAFSGPIIPRIPAEARIKSRSGRNFDAQEPTSPKISCMGTIKHKKDNSKMSIKKPMTPQPPRKDKKPKHQSSGKWNLFRGGDSKKEKDSDSEIKSARQAPAADKVPGLSQMKTFATSRDTLADFDWKLSLEGDNDDDEEDEVIVPHSAPIMIGGGNRVAVEPKKEINLWKRRTMDPPKPLQLNRIVGKP